MSKKLLPFSMYPYSWGLKGKARAIARAQYELTGYELATELLNIRAEELTPDEFEAKSAEIEFTYKKITEGEYLRKQALSIQDSAQRALALLELDYKESKLTDTEYAKQTATLKGEPWVTVVDMAFGGEKSLEGSFELDWNEAFVDDLRTKGYVGPTPDIIVNQWFMEVCRNVALDEFDGTGNFTADSGANLDAVKRWATPTAMPNGRSAHQ